MLHGAEDGRAVCFAEEGENDSSLSAEHCLAGPALALVQLGSRLRRGAPSWRYRPPHSPACWPTAAGDYEARQQAAQQAAEAAATEKAAEKGPAAAAAAAAAPKGMDLDEVLKELPPMPAGWKPGDPIPGLGQAPAAAVAEAAPAAAPQVRSAGLALWNVVLLVTANCMRTLPRPAEASPADLRRMHACGPPPQPAPPEESEEESEEEEEAAPAIQQPLLASAFALGLNPDMIEFGQGGSTSEESSEEEESE